MTGRTHDLAAFTALSFVIATQTLPQMTLATALVAFSANMIGGLAPDLDQPSASLYGKIRGGHLLSKIIDPLLGSHRLLSHSLLGTAIFAFITNFILQKMGSVLLVDMDIIWWSFMIGFVSHLVMDTFTHEGVPWLFPLPLRIGFPPFRFLRMKTGGFLEKSLVFPGLFFLNGYLVFTHYQVYLSFLKHTIK